MLVPLINLQSILHLCL